MAQNQIKWCSTYLLLIVKMLDTQSGNHLVLLFSSQSVAIEQILGTYDVLHDMLCGVAIIIEQRKWRFGYWSPHAAPSYLLIQQLWLSSQNYSSPLMVRRLCVVCTKKGADGCCWLVFQQYYIIVHVSKTLQLLQYLLVHVYLTDSGK